MVVEDHVVVHPKVLYVGTPAYLIATQNADGTANLAPASSYWALGQTLVLGIESDGQTAENLLERPEITVNFPSGGLWEAVVRLSVLTGRNPVPGNKVGRYRFEPHKFDAAGLTPQPSELVGPPRVAECDLQFEARVSRTTESLDQSFYLVEADVVRVHASPRILVADSDHIDPAAWHPLVYSFRHFFDRGAELGRVGVASTAGAERP